MIGDRVVLVEAYPTFPMGPNRSLAVLAHPQNVGNGTADTLSVRTGVDGVARPQAGIYSARAVSATEFNVVYPDGQQPAHAFVDAPYSSSLFDPPLDFTIRAGDVPFAAGDLLYFQIDRDVPLPTVRVDPGRYNVGAVVPQLMSARDNALSGLYTIICMASGIWDVWAPDGRSLPAYLIADAVHGVYRGEELQFVIFDDGTAVNDTFSVTVDASIRASHGTPVPIWRGVDWLARLETGLSYDVDAFKGTTGLGGASVPGSGTVRMLIGDRPGQTWLTPALREYFDRLAVGFYDGRTLRAYVGTQAANGTPTTVAQVFTATCLEATYDDATLTIALRDFAERLNVPIQRHLYGGTGGLDGVAELKNRSKPITYGDVRVAIPVFVCAPEIYQVSDGEVSSIQPEEGGVPYTPFNGGLNDVADISFQSAIPPTGITAVASGTATDLTINRGTTWPAVTGELVGRTVELQRVASTGHGGGSGSAVAPFSTLITAYVVSGTTATLTVDMTRDPPYGPYWYVRVLPGDSHALEDWTPVAGTFITDLARGYFRLGNPPLLPLTAHVVTPLLTASPILDDAVKRSGALGGEGVTTFDADPTSLPLGIQLTEPMTVAAFLDLVTQTLGALWTFDAAGFLVVRAVAIDPASAVEIPAAHVARCERVRTQLPVGELHFNVGRNYKPLSREQVAASVTNPALWVDPFAATAIAMHAGVKDARRLWRTLTIDTVLAWNAGTLADAEVTRQLALLSNTDATSDHQYSRDVHELEVTHAAFAMPLGQTVRFTFAPLGPEGDRLPARFGLQDRHAVVLGIGEKTDGELTTVRVWG